MSDGLPRNYEAWQQAPYQQKELKFECCSCSKQYDEEIDRCTICGEKVNEKDDSNYFNEWEPERDQDR